MADAPTPINTKKAKSNRIAKIMGIMAACFVLFFIVLNVFYVYVEPNEFGIRIKLVGPNAGVQEEVYETGLNLVIPTINSIEKLPKDIQIIELTSYPDNHFDRRNVKVGRAAHIQTSDGFYVDVDASILYRIVDPHKVMTTLGKKGIYENSILPKVEPALKRTLGKLTTEEFYQSTLRVKQTENARDILSKEFNVNGLEVLEVLVRYFKYSDEIQKNIEEKKLKDQLVFKNQAEKKAATEAAILKRIVQEGEATMKVKLEEGRAYVTKKRAEMDLYSRKKKAEANLLIKLAEAEKTRLKNDALKIMGSENLVGIEMAKLLSGVQMIMLSSDGSGGLNPLDLENTLKMFDVQQ